MFVKLAVYILDHMHHFTIKNTHVQSLHNLCIIWDINGLMVGTVEQKLFHLPLHVSVYLLNQ